MERFIDKCYKCKVKVKSAKVIKNKIELSCLKCPKCKEEFFTAGELTRYDIIRGKKSILRRFGILGDSLIVRVPPKIIEKQGIKPGDYAQFEVKDGNIVIKTVKQ